MMPSTTTPPTSTASSSINYNHHHPPSLHSWIYSLFASSIDPIIACDIHGHVCAWNQGAATTFGISSKQALGKDLNQLLFSPSPSSPAQLYPSTPAQIRALEATAPLKRVMSRKVQSSAAQRTFLESISPVYATTATATAAAAADTPLSPAHSPQGDDINNYGDKNNNTNSSSGSIIQFTPGSAAPEDNEEIPSFSTSTSTASRHPSYPTPPADALVGFAVYFTDLTSLTTTSVAAPSPDASLGTTATPRIHPGEIAIGSLEPKVEFYMDHALQLEKETSIATDARPRPSSLDRPSSRTTSSAAPASISPFDPDESPDDSYSNVVSATPSLSQSRSNSISLPVSEPSPAARSSTRSTSLGQLLALPPLDRSAGSLGSPSMRPRALSVATTAVSSTSSGAQLSVSVSSSADKSQLVIHHNSLAPTSDPSFSTSLVPAGPRLEIEWDDAYFPYLAPIATSLMTCHGDHFFDLVVEEIAVHLGVKYAFISQLVSLEELKELDPTEYMNLIEQFGGLLPPIDGVMHNISNFPGDPNVNPHAFQGYLADCTIQEKLTSIHSGLAGSNSDIADCLNDPTIESYVGLRLETNQGEIVGVIGVIHDKKLTQQDGSIVQVVLEQVGVRVANELDRLKIEANLVYARDVAESMAKNKTKFLANMSHEIRNPMNAVVGVTDILLDTAGLSDEQTNYIEVIRTSGQHLLTVINDVLDISRIDQDVKFLLERRPLSLRKCLKDAVSLAGLTPLHDVSRSISVIEWPPEMDDLGPFSELEETNILPLLWSIDHNVPEHLLGDITRLRQVLINLCTNSLKFTQRGRVSVRVSVHRPTPQYPTIRPNCTPTITRSSPLGGQIYSSYSEGSESSLPSSPMLTGSDHRPPMVFQQRYDVRAETGSPVHHKPSPAPSRRRQADKRLTPLPAPTAPVLEDRESSRQGTTVMVPSLTVVAPTANSLERDAMDENSVILEFSVSDTGVGIPANKITELFTSFSQVDISVSTRFGGTGLGLAISASLVEKMGGNIWVESTEGVGSRFTFTIPFTICPSSETDSHPSATAPPSPVSTPMRRETNRIEVPESIQLPAAAVEHLPSTLPAMNSSADAVLMSKTPDSATKPVETPVTPPSSSSSSGKPAMPSYAKVVESTLKPLTINDVPLRILLAEDNQVNQKIAVGVLKKLGYDKVDVAENGLEVIDRLDRGSVYDVILMDVNMPVMDGIDATRTIVDRRRRALLSTYSLQDSSADKPVGSLYVIPLGEETVCTVPKPNGMAEPSASFKDYENIYVIALTASAMGSDKERCMEAGMDDFMTKPFALLEMKRVLNEYIGRWLNGTIMDRNKACLASALAAAKSRCNSPHCQGGSPSLKDHSLQSAVFQGRSPSGSVSDLTLTENGPVGCQGCGGSFGGDGSGLDASGMEAVSTLPTVSSTGRPCRQEAPRAFRRPVDGLGSNGYATARRSQSEITLNGQSPPTHPLGSIIPESALLSRRASDAFTISKREWRRGLGLSTEGSPDLHPLDSSHEGIKRATSPSHLSREHLSMLFQPMVSPLSPLSLLTTDTEGTSSVSPPLSTETSPTDSNPRPSGFSDDSKDSDKEKRQDQKEQQGQLERLEELKEINKVQGDEYDRPDPRPTESKGTLHGQGSQSKAL